MAAAMSPLVLTFNQFNTNCIFTPHKVAAAAASALSLYQQKVFKLKEA